MRILLDYRPALHERTGVGEFVHELARALVRTGPDEVRLFSTSFKYRPSAAAIRDLNGARLIHRRLPVRGLTWTWNRLGWPPVEWLTGSADVVHSPSPVMIPSRRGARVITINDLDFLLHPERAEAEMRRDFPRLVRSHARDADHIVVLSNYMASHVKEHFGVPAEKITVCSLGAPAWAAEIARARATNTVVTSGTRGTVNTSRSILFVGTLEPRKNIGTLLGAYARLRECCADVPPLTLAGRARPSVDRELAAARSGALAGHVTALGYVPEARRRELYRDAAMLVLVSLDEGFGLPVLEAMACGVPIVISDRGSLPEIAGDAAVPVDATDPHAIADAMARLLEPEPAAAAAARGTLRASRYSWDACATAARGAYRAAVAHRARRSASPVTRAGEAF